MRVFDQRFRQDTARYVSQCLLATGAILIVLILLNTILDTTVIASLGASCFIAFTMPRAQISRPRFLIGGYVVGMAAGCTGRWLCAAPALMELAPASVPLDALCGALAVGLAIFVMVVTDTEHPPAAGLALGLVLNEAYDARVLAVVLIGIVALSLAKEVLKPLLIDLL